MAEITCDRYLDLVAAAADGCLQGAEAAAARAHARQCERCRAETEVQRHVRERLRRIPARRAPEGLRARVLAATAPAAAAPRRRRMPAARVVLAGAVAALLVLALWPLVRSSAPDLAGRIVADLAWAEEVAQAGGAAAVAGDDALRAALAGRGWTLAAARPWEFRRYRGRVEVYRKGPRVLAVHRFSPAPPGMDRPAFVVRRGVTIYVVPRGDGVLCFAARMGQAELQGELPAVAAG